MPATGDLESEAHAQLGLGELARQRDDHAVAAASCERGLALLRELGDPSHTGIALHNLGWVAIATDRLDEATRLFHEDLHLELAVGSRDGPAFSMAGFAAVLQARGDADTAVLALAAASAHLDALGIKPPPADAREWERVRTKLRAALGDDAFDAAWSASSAQSFPAAIERVRERLGLDVPGGELASPPTPPAPPPRTDPIRPAAASAEAAQTAVLRVRALGPLEIHVAGELISQDVWRYTRPRELLLHLLAHPGGRTRDQIGLVFWPDASPAQVKNSFHVTLHHLRKALGSNDWVVLENERYRVNTALGCEFDATLFEQQIRQALREARSGVGPLDPERLASVLALYRGDFVEDEVVGDWHLEIRDHLRRLWLEGMLALSELLMHAERWSEAVETCQRIVRREDLHEEAHRRLMLSLARAGDRSRALKHYAHLVTLLRMSSMPSRSRRPRSCTNDSGRPRPSERRRRALPPQASRGAWF